MRSTSHPAMQGYYQLQIGDLGRFHFTLRAPNHEVILSSQLYAARENAEKGIQSARANGPEEDRYERKLSAKQQPYFLLKAANGQIIGVSEMYETEQSRDDGIRSVMTHSASEAIDDRTAGVAG